MSEPQQLLVNELVIATPNIITQLARLISAPMQQLDTAFRPSTAMAKEDVSSPLIEYPHSFRATLLQISQRLSDAFRKANTNVKEIGASIATMNTTVQRLNPSRSSHPASLSLSKLRNSTETNYQLANQVVADFKRVANLTKAVVDAVAGMFEGKVRQASITLDEEDKLKTDLSNLDFEIKSLTESLNQQVSQNNLVVYKRLEEISQMWQSTKEKNPCIESYLRSSIVSSDCIDRPPLDVDIDSIISFVNQSDWQNWSSKMHMLNEKDLELRQKREQHHNLILTFKKVEREKLRLDESIQLLNKSKNPLDEMDKELNKLIGAWTNFTVHCSRIHSHAKNMTNVTNSRTKASTVTKTSKPAIFNKKEMEEDLLLLGRFTEVYARFYDEHLADLSANVEKMMTVNRVQATELVGKIVKASSAALRSLAQVSRDNQDAAS